MKILLAIALIATAAAVACALDLGGFFNCRAKASAQVPAVPAPSAAPKPGRGDFPVNLKPEEARYFIESANPVVIDIRTAEEHAAGYIQPTHQTLDYYAPEFKERLAKLDRNAGYLLYCRSGRRTGAALQAMKDLGFTDSHDIAGGITAWAAAGLPVVK
jgi:phage shock protein E